MTASRALRVDVLQIGHLSRNRYWGESDERARRPPLCTTSLVRCPGGPTIVVDPGLEPEGTRETLSERAGLRAEAVDLILLTHFHADHRVGVDAFPRARRVMAGAELEAARSQAATGSGEAALLATLEPAEAFEWPPGLQLLSTPGHTGGHHSLFVDAGGIRVTVAGDAVMTQDVFRHREVYFNTGDRKRAVATIEEIGRRSDLVVPGHDNVFVVSAARAAGD